VLHLCVQTGRSAVAVVSRRHRAAVDRLQRHNQVNFGTNWSSVSVYGIIFPSLVVYNLKCTVTGTSRKQHDTV